MYLKVKLLPLLVKFFYEMVMGDEGYCLESIINVTGPSFTRETSIKD
jgi:hypothetical protein